MLIIDLVLEYFNMNYDQTYSRRERLIEKVDKISADYLDLATELLEKSSNFEHTSQVTNIDIMYDGINFEYCINDYDYSSGKGSYFISKEILDEKIVKFTRKKKLALLNILK